MENDSSLLFSFIVNCNFYSFWDFSLPSRSFFLVNWSVLFANAVCWKTGCVEIFLFLICMFPEKRWYIIRVKRKKWFKQDILQFFKCLGVPFYEIIYIIMMRIFTVQLVNRIFRHYMLTNPLEIFMWYTSKDVPRRFIKHS